MEADIRPYGLRALLLATAVVLAASWSADGVRAGLLGVPLAPANPNLLRVAPSQFSPATLMDCDRILTTATIDSRTALFPRRFHSAAYSTWGRTTGWCQARSWIPAGTKARIEFDYYPSLFKLTRGAANAWTDGTGYVPRKFSKDFGSKTCHLGNGCSEIQSRAGYATATLIYEILYQRCLLELRAVSGASLYAAYGPQMQKTLLALAQAAVGRARLECQVPTTTTPTPTPTLTPTATPRPKPTATHTPVPKPHAVSVTFTKLEILDDHHKQAKTFKAGHKLFVDASWTVKYSEGKHHAQLTTTWEISVKGKWKKDPQLVPGVLSTESVNGKNSAQEQYLCPGGHSKFRIDVTLKLLKKTQTKKAVISVK
jgi:hypothetical protein